MQYIIRLNNKSYKNLDAIDKVYKYMTQPSKAGGMVGGFNVIPEHAVYMMKAVKQIYNKEGGRQLLHIILSFPPGVAVADEAMFDISSYIASYFRNHQVVFSIHSDTNHMHSHFMVNTISFADGSKITNNSKINQDLHALCDAILNPQN